MSILPAHSGCDLARIHSFIVSRESRLRRFQMSLRNRHYPEIHWHNLKIAKLNDAPAYRLSRIVDSQNQHEIFILLHQILIQTLCSSVYIFHVYMTWHNLHIALFTFYLRLRLSRLCHAVEYMAR